MVNNGWMPRRPAARVLRCAIAVTVLTAAVTLTGCGAGHPPSVANPTPSSAKPIGPVDAEGQLAGLAAAAHDRRYVAAYTISGAGGSGRSLLASLATDGTWQVNVDGGALDGDGNVAIVGLKTGTYQCLLSGPATTAAIPTPPPVASLTPSPSGPAGASTSASSSPSPVRYPAPVCVKVAAAGKPIPKKYDPVFEHIFTDWLAVMLDRTAPISVFPASFPASRAASRLAHSAGSCYSVESSSASLAPVIGSGIFCFTADGTLTAAKIRSGTLTISGSAVAAPPTTTLPAPISTGPAAPTKAPPPAP